MRIILMTSSLGAGGAERVASTLCNEWVKEGHEVTLVATFSGGGSAFYPLLPSVNVIFLADLVPARKKSLGSYWRRLLVLRKIISSGAADVVISFLPNVNVAAILATAFTKIPVVISERRDPVSQPASRFWEFACANLYKFSDAVVVQTEGVLRSIGSLYPSLKRVICIPNPLPRTLEQFRHKDSAASRRVLLSIGRLVPAKQIEHSIRAFGLLANIHENWDLHIYGDGPAHAKLDSLICELSLQERVLLMGETTTPWDVMAKADAFVMTSQHEGFPNALLEAMGIGLPCAVYDCLSGPREITRDGLDALLVPLNDQGALTQAIRRIMSDDALRKELGDRARTSVFLRYELKVVLNQWTTVFRQIGAAV